MSVASVFLKKTGPNWTMVPSLEYECQSELFNPRLSLPLHSREYLNPGLPLLLNCAIVARSGGPGDDKPAQLIVQHHSHKAGCLFFDRLRRWGS